MKLPKITLEVIERTNIPSEKRFLKSVTHWMRAHYEDGTISEQFKVDNVDRKNIDASVIVPYYVNDNEEIIVYLRSSLRPGVAAKEIRNLNDEEVKGKMLETGVLWELAAGLIEANESPKHAAVRELREEVGFEVDENNVYPLGRASYPCVGLMGELLHFFFVKVDPKTRLDPTLDGSVMERNAAIIEASLADCWDLLDEGLLRDMKTEIGIRRLKDRAIAQKTV